MLTYLPFSIARGCLSCSCLFASDDPPKLQTVKEEISVLAELPLYVREQDAPDLYKMSEEDGVEVGPFTVRCCCLFYISQEQGSSCWGCVAAQHTCC